MKIEQNSTTASSNLSKRVYVQRRRAVAALAVAILATAWFATNQSATQANEMVSVTVAQGESLWSLAEVFAPENQDPREWIYEVTQINNLETSELTPGMRLTVPTTAE